MNERHYMISTYFVLVLHRNELSKENKLVLLQGIEIGFLISSGLKIYAIGGSFAGHKYLNTVHTN